HISNILDTTLKNYRPKSDMEMTRIWDLWGEAVGDEVAKNAKPAAFKEGTLIVNVSSSVWIQHLKFLEKDMISNINHILNKKLVKKVRFKIAKLHN
ncbi:MAG: DUF721 domain-containing protein, partial [Desulfobacteraceae bacterium]|nr:DUF721 domain-containing protein [Desulfobacteraceae bacterium]